MSRHRQAEGSGDKALKRNEFHLFLNIKGKRNPFHSHIDFEESIFKPLDFHQVLDLCAKFNKECPKDHKMIGRLLKNGLLESIGGYKEFDFYRSFPRAQRKCGHILSQSLQRQIERQMDGIVF